MRASRKRSVEFRIGLADCKGLCERGDTCLGEEAMQMTLSECNASCDQGGQADATFYCMVDCNDVSDCSEWMSCVSNCM
ncbi:MAG: hypothetical protein JXX29_19570 [Deltaproteobacteria bacterium]|nr:hypothetical protein [Deltaproteobacteria bacterium]MBN2673889.1 hypothetical protein [Deltaproteobacteria bacterium]